LDYSSIIFDRKNDHAIITLNRPDKLNALNRTTFDELDDATGLVESDGSVRALVITGSGKAFAAGADIRELQAVTAQTAKEFSQYGSAILTRIEQLAIPVIAAVNGYALGGGCELALACHIRFASDNVVMGLPELNLGIIPGYGGTQRLTRIAGRAKALELILSGEAIGAEEALRIGLVNAVFPQDQLMARTLEFVEKLLKKAPLAVTAAIKAVRAAAETTLAEGPDYESGLFAELCSTEDFREGTAAFLQKRKVIFNGR